MVEKKTQSVLKVKESVPCDIQAVLESLFFRSYSTGPVKSHSLSQVKGRTWCLPTCTTTYLILTSILKIDYVN